MATRTKLVLCAAAIAALVPGACASELVSLRNGFEVRCHHHAQVEGHMRLYLTAGEDNYIEIAPQEVVSVQNVPDPPPTLATTQAPATQLEPSPNSSAQLSPGDLRQLLTRAGADHNLDVDLLASLVKTESNGNAHAVSSAGARGLMQLMPGTAAELGVSDSFQPNQNVQGGSAYLDSLLVRYHDNLALALAAYNAGPLAVDRYHGIPPYRETRAYVARVIHEFNRRVRVREAQARRDAKANQAAQADPTPSNSTIASNRTVQ